MIHLIKSSKLLNLKLIINYNKVINKKNSNLLKMSNLLTKKLKKLKKKLIKKLMSKTILVKNQFK